MKSRAIPMLKTLPGTPITISALQRTLRAVATFARRRPLGAMAGLTLIGIGIIAAAAPLLAPHDPLYVDIHHFKENPSISFPVGTDYVGRGILSRVIYGTRTSMQVGFLAVILGTSTGFIWGLTTAYFGGRIDIIGQRILEVLMSFPALILAMVLVAGLGAGFWVVVIAIGITRVPHGGRVIRSVALSAKENDYVLAARAIGAGDLRVMAFHIAPQCMTSFLVMATAHLGVAIIIEASLGFIGVGIPAPTPTWGNMLGGAVASVLVPHWPVVVFPGIAITVTVLAFNIFGDAIRDAIDPRLKGAASG